MKCTLLLILIFSIQIPTTSQAWENIESFKGSGLLDHVYSPFESDFEETEMFLGYMSPVFHRFSAAVKLIRSCNLVFVDHRLVAKSTSGEVIAFHQIDNARSYYGIITRTNFERLWHESTDFRALESGYTSIPQDFTENLDFTSPIIYKHLKFLDDHGYEFDEDSKVFIPTKEPIQSCNNVGLFS